MKTKFIEASSPQGNWGKFMVGEFTGEEWNRRSAVDGCSMIAGRGWTPDHYLVLDLQTGEGAIFRHGGYAKADLHKHRVWVCPLFEPFLAWLYKQDLHDLDELPSSVTIDHPLELAGYRRPGPEAAREEA